MDDPHRTGTGNIPTTHSSMCHNKASGDSSTEMHRVQREARATRINHDNIKMMMIIPQQQHKDNEDSSNSCSDCSSTIDVLSSRSICCNSELPLESKHNAFNDSTTFARQGILKQNLIDGPSATTRRQRVRFHSVLQIKGTTIATARNEDLSETLWYTKSDYVAFKKEWSVEVEQCERYSQDNQKGATEYPYDDDNDDDSEMAFPFSLRNASFYNVLTMLYEDCCRATRQEEEEGDCYFDTFYVSTDDDNNGTAPMLMDENTTARTTKDSCWVGLESTAIPSIRRGRQLRQEKLLQMILLIQEQFGGDNEDQEHGDDEEKEYRDEPSSSRNNIKKQSSTSDAASWKKAETIRAIAQELTRPCRLLAFHLAQIHSSRS